MQNAEDEEYLVQLTRFIQAWQIGDTRSNLPHNGLYLSHDFLVTLLPRHTERIKIIKRIESKNQGIYFLGIELSLGYS